MKGKFTTDSLHSMVVTDEWLVAPLSKVRQILKIPIQGLFRGDGQIQEVETFKIEDSNIERFTVLEGN